jgi:5-formyltetrahydrofolate cyclo-ligase
VDIIVTPTRTIRVPDRAPKPSGVFWDLLSPQKLAQIRVLRQLKQQIEEREQIELPSGPDEVLPPTASRKNTGENKKRRKNNKNRTDKERKSQEGVPNVKETPAAAKD